MLLAEELRRIVRYEPETGDFVWLVGYGRRKAGSTASKRPYIQFTFSGKLLYAHRLAWLYVYGHFPECDLDHINGDPSDNRISNLRLATPQQNSANRPPHKDNKSGLKGVCLLPSGKYMASIKDGQRVKYIGLFDDPHVAYEAFRREEVRIHGEYAWTATDALQPHAL